MEYKEQPKSDVETPHNVDNSSQEMASPGPSVGEIDSRKERALIWKMDLHILPFVVLLYLFSFLDRGMLNIAGYIGLLVDELAVNIGNGRLYGLEEDLGLVGNQYQIAVSILFVTYCVSLLTKSGDITEGMTMI